MKTVLLIDDDDLTRESAAALLAYAGWTVIEAHDGQEGFEMALQKKPDLILVDLLMPRLNGFQLVRLVREHLELRHTRVIVFTGRDYSADRKSAEEAGADDYLVKPLDMAKLQSALDRFAPSATVGGDAGDFSNNQPTQSGAMIRFWGVRGSIPSPGPATVYYGGNTSCVELRTGGQIIILDAGSGIRALGRALMEEFGPRPMRLTLLITHTHWDHIQGFPFFIPAYNTQNQIRIYGYEGSTSGLRTTLAGQMESPYFPVALEQMPSHLAIEEVREMEFHVGSVRIEACFTNHPGVCVAYKLHTNGGTVVYMPDNETPVPQKGRPVGPGPVPFEKKLVDFVRNADLFIHDAQYTAEEYTTHVGWGHACVDETVRLAREAGVKRLFLFHHDPMHDDRQVTEMLRHARELASIGGCNLIVEAAREGETLKLEPAI